MEWRRGVGIEPLHLLGKEVRPCVGLLLEFQVYKIKEALTQWSNFLVIEGTDEKGRKQEGGRS